VKGIFKGEGQLNKKAIGSVLMILGTCVGAGMLAMPIASAQENFHINLVCLLAAWAVMFLGAFAIIEVNLWCQPGSNLVSMAKTTLGSAGKYFTTAIYLLLMYSLICAYLAGVSDILQALLQEIHITVPRWLSTVLGLFVLGSIVYGGIDKVDVANRILMITKMVVYVVIVSSMLPHVTLTHLQFGDSILRNTSFMVMVTSFGYATILPTIRQYLGSDRKLLTKVTIIGSCLPLVIFLIWLVAVQGLLPRDGADGLLAISQSGDTNSLLMASISKVLDIAWLSDLARLFISIYAITSFLGVSISLADFVADGLSKKKVGLDGLLVHALTFLPPLVIVLVSPGIFISALTYAGIWCIILLLLLPFLMLYAGRYRKGLFQQEEAIMPGGKVLLLTVLFFSFVLLIIQVTSLFL
jgi:tyrosine-specific transport protein